MSLPDGWERLGAPTSGTLTLAQAVVLAKVDQPRTSITWMVRGYPATEETVDSFSRVTATEAIADNDTILRMVNGIFPLIGTLDESATVNLPDGSKAIETIEGYFEGEIKRGYQLVIPLQLPDEYAPTFQRLCFYARDDVFRQNLYAVRTAAQSFRYDRPYGYVNVK